MTYDALGELIKTEREKQGWDQALLASMVGVGQQAVSRWEQGKSRPKRDDLHKLIDLFGVEPDTWLSTAGYEHGLGGNTLLQFLPLESLSAENFELFCGMLISFLTKADVHRYGVSGNAQRGIDLYAELPEGKTSYQCKRHRQFGAKDVHAAVKADTFGAKYHYILLSRRATTAARDAMDGYSHWKLWDREDMSAKVRTLSKNDQLTLIETYFPRLRKDFLGIDEPSIWLSREQFFQPLANRTKLFSHGWDFVGRTAQLRELAQFWADNNAYSSRALILCGPGGVGKSRLLREWTGEVEKSAKVIFMTTGAGFRPKDFELLPVETALLVIDDAHERNDLATLLEGVVRARPQLKVVLSTRNYAVLRIQEDLLKSGIRYDYSSLVKLGDLSGDEAESLSREITSSLEGDLRYVKQIAQITKDCPLATVIGSRLVALGQIKPEILNNSEEFRKQLFSKFRDVITGEIGSPKDSESIHNLLAFIAMVQPVNPTSPAFYKAAEKLIDLRADKIVQLIRLLEDAGVLLRRNSGLRITPDLLADFIRADESYDERGKMPTTYADKVFDAVDDEKIAANELVANVLVNLSQLDWRLSSDGTQTALLNEVWQKLKKKFLAAKIYERHALMTTLERVSYYQPAASMDFLKFALAHTTDLVEDDPFLKAWGHKPSYEYVKQQLPPVLRYIAYHGEYLDEALDLLKDLADDKSDKRQPNQYPDHPLRILKDIASIEPGKPVEFNNQIVDHILTWLSEDHNFSPFDILDTLLATEGNQAATSGRELTLTPYKVNSNVVEPFRQKVINAAFDCLYDKSLKKAIRATQTLGEAVSGPHPIGAQDVTEEDQQSWEPGIISVLQRLEKIASDTNLDPIVAVEFREIVSWQANYGRPQVKSAAKKVLDAIPTNLDYELTRAVVDGWGWTFEKAPGSPSRDEAALFKWREELAAKLIVKYNAHFGALLDKLDERLVALKEVSTVRHAEPGHFVAVLITQSSDFGRALAHRILSDRQSALPILFGVILTVLGEKSNQDEALKLAKAGLETQDEILIARISSAIGWSMFRVPISEEDISIARQLAQHPDPNIRYNIIRIVKRPFTIEQKADLLDILVSIKFETKQLADEVLGEIGSENNPHAIFKVTDLSDMQLKAIRKQLVICDSIDDYNIGLFLGALFHYKPDFILDLLFERAEERKKHRDIADNYHAVPYTWRGQPPFNFQDSSSYERLLRRVRDWVAEKPDDWFQNHLGAEIFKVVSANYDDTTLLVLQEAIMSGNKSRLESAAVLLSEAYRTFVWEKTDYVVNLLEQAQKHGKSCYERVSSWLIASAIQGVRSGIPGKPFAEDLEQMNRSEELMNALPVGSAGQKFYKLLYEGARAKILRDSADDFDD